MNDPRLIILVSFLFSIMLARLIVFILDKTNRLKQVRPHFKSFEIHHITTGVIILIIAGYLSLTNVLSISKNILSFLFGFGLGLVVDELWAGSVVLSRHWNDEGIEYYKRPTYLAIFIVAVLLLILILI